MVISPLVKSQEDSNGKNRKKKIMKFAAIEEAYYPATLVDIKEVPSKYRDKNDKPRDPSLRIIFSVDNMENIRASILMSPNLRPGTHLDLVLRACGYNTDIGDEFDTDEVVAMGLRARVFIESTTPDAEGNVFYNIAKDTQGKPKIKSIDAVSQAPVPAVKVPAPVPVTPEVKNASHAAKAETSASLEKQPARQPVADVEELDFGS